MAQKQEDVTATRQGSIGAEERGIAGELADTSVRLKVVQPADGRPPKLD